MVKNSVSQVLVLIGLSIHQSKPVYRKSCFMQDYRYCSQDQYIISPTFCRTIDTLVKISVSLVLFFVGLLSQSRAVCHFLLFVKLLIHLCIVSPSFFRTIDTLVITSVSLVLIVVITSIHQSRPVSRPVSLVLLPVGLLIQGHCDVSPTFCSTIDTLIKTSVSFILHFVGGRSQVIGSEDRSWCLMFV